MMAPFKTRAEVNDRVAELGVAAAGGELGVAALLYTYRCTIACRHCCFACATARGDVRMTTGQAVRHLRSLHRIGRVIHVAGGECMMYWDDLKAALAAAHAEGVQPHFIETNCSFAADDEIVRDRLETLAACGVAGILLSADPYHQAFVPPERFLRVRRMATETFGPGNVWCTDQPDEQIRELAEIARDPRRLRDYVRAHPPMLVGRAHHELAPLLDEHPLAEMPLETGWHTRYRARDCAIDFRRETIWEIHVDPYDNIQTNCGVILADANVTPPEKLMAHGPETANWIVELLVGAGPFGLVEFAMGRHGFVPPETARSKCDLCYEVRSFLRAFYPDILGPEEVYGA